jgi:hypothetical protein
VQQRREQPRRREFTGQGPTAHGRERREAHQLLECVRRDASEHADDDDPAGLALDYPAREEFADRLAEPPARHDVLDGSVEKALL